ncbi:MAG: TonB-dependent receptor [Candidatus Baltobacteraceae bacterium]|jgi:outer membrane receptor protein involved in Fe transport
MRRFAAAFAAASLLFFARAAQADTSGLVRGTVTLGGRPAAGASVTLSGEGTTSQALTDAKGRFTFSRVLFGRYTLLFHREGSADASRSIDVESDAVVSVAVELSELKQIAQTQSTFTAHGVSASPVSVNSLDRAQIAALPQNQSLDRLIETLPGIVRFSYNEPVAHGFHGLTYELDGVPLPQGTTSNFSEIIDPRTIDSLEVFTGAFPAEYGGSRQGAVVNIISHRSTDLSAPEEGSVTAGLGTYGSAESSVADSFRLGNTRVFLDANLERTNRGIDSPTFDPVHDASNQSNQFLRTITNLGPRDTLAFDASNNFATFQIPLNDTFNPNDPQIVPAGTDDVQREYDSFFNLVYTHNAADGNSYTQVAPWYHYDRVVYDGDFPNDLLGYTINVPPPNTPGSGLRQDRHSEFEGLRLTHFHVFGDNAVKLGADGSIENFEGNEAIAYFAQNPDGSYATAPSFFSDDSAQRGTQFGAYIEDKWTPTRYLSLQGGLRYDHSTGYVSGAQLSPRFEIDGQVDPQDILHFYYGSLYAAPFLEDTRRAAVVLSGGTPGTLPLYDLQPEHDQYYEFGLAHQLTPGARGTLNFWKRDVRDVLDTTQLANTPIFAVFNNTIGIAKGVEGRVDSRWQNGDSLFFSTQLSSSLAGGISGSTFLFPPSSGVDPSDVTLSPEDHDQTFSATAGYTKRLGRDRSLYASLSPQYGTGYPVQFQNGSGRLPPHLTFDASFGRDPQRGPKRSLGFSADFENFTNTVYLLKVSNGFNTTQWGPGFKASFRLTEPF